MTRFHKRFVTRTALSLSLAAMPVAIQAGAASEAALKPHDIQIAQAQDQPQRAEERIQEEKQRQQRAQEEKRRQQRAQEDKQRQQRAEEDKQRQQRAKEDKQRQQRAEEDKQRHQRAKEDKQRQQRAEEEKQRQQRAEEDKQRQQRAEEDKQRQQRAQEEKQRQQRAQEDKRRQQRAEEDKQRQQRAEEDKQRQQRAQEDKQRQQRAEEDKRRQQRADEDKRRQQRAEEEKKQTDRQSSPRPGKDQPARAEQEQTRGDDPRQASGEVVRPKSRERRDGQRADRREGANQRRENAAPVLDSAKERPRGNAAQRNGNAERERRPEDRRARSAEPPRSDAAAQPARARPQRIEPVRAEQGRRIERRSEREQRWDRPRDARVVRSFDDNRVIINYDDRTFVEHYERPRLTHGASDIYYEELPRGRYRETIVRPGGVQVVTVRNRYGDVIRRSRIMPDGREIILVYVEDDYYDDVYDWRNPGAGLGPLELLIPVSQYILTAGQVNDPGVYYDFLGQPPVEELDRIYSIDEVRRSARIRDTVPRIDLDTVTFDFGSAAISESEIPRLEAVAEAMARLLEENPGETFMIEGHTDAVGSEYANLALSDRRAESVAEALTNVFDIPPENLVTQGYGEEYLKVATSAPERENRRVAIRRITPLVAPVASAQ